MLLEAMGSALWCVISWEKENLHSERSGETTSLVVVVPGCGNEGIGMEERGGFLLCLLSCWFFCSMNKRERGRKSRD